METTEPPFMEGYPKLTIEIMGLVADKWSLLTVYILGEGALRFSELRRRAVPISQKMLTQTLRVLERHGLVVRRVLPTAPPQVEYSLSPLGRSFLSAASVICAWTRDNLAEVEASRQRFDQERSAA